MSAPEYQSELPGALLRLIDNPHPYLAEDWPGIDTQAAIPLSEAVDCLKAASAVHSVLAASLIIGDGNRCSEPKRANLHAGTQHGLMLAVGALIGCAADRLDQVSVWQNARSPRDKGADDEC